jgi:hypothetical protein
MNSPIDVIGLLNQFSPVTHANSLLGLFLKFMFYAVFILFAVLGFVMIRQVRIMGQTIQTPLEPLLHIMAWAFFLLTLAILVFAIVSL